jgi:hypothetical protein
MTSFSASFFSVLFLASAAFLGGLVVGVPF